MQNSHRLLLFLSFVLFSSCESQESKDTRLGLDLAARKLNLFEEQFLESKDEEGQQSKLTLSDFYGKHTDKLDEVSEAIAILPSTEKYSLAKEHLKTNISLVKNLVNTRRALINSVTQASSSYKSYLEQGRKKDEYWDEYRNSGYRYDFYQDYSNQALSRQINEMLSFIDAKYESRELVDSLFSLNDSINTIIAQYNWQVSESKLIDSLISLPLLDTTGRDWLLSAQLSIDKLSVSDDE